MRSIASTPFVRVLCGMLLSAIAESAIAVDGAYVTVGGGQHVGVYGLGLSWAPWKTLPINADSSLSLRGVAGVALWDARNGSSDQSLINISVYPVLRLDMTSVPGVVPYIEGSVGFNLLSRTRIDDRELSTAFQFGEYVGVGLAFGDKRQYDVGVRYQHVSNADIKKPNDGLTFGSVVFQYRFGSP